jgi:protein kinase C substrate 80K-H
MLIENGILASPQTDGTESKALQDARSRLDTAKSDSSARKADLENGEADLIKDYGPHGIFRALKDQCVEKDSGEYTYEFCWMGSTTQKPKKGGMNTNMGNFDRIEMIVVDEEEAPDGKGLGSGERLALKYDNGAHCWNGPARTTTIILACAEKNEIWKIVEEEKCVYRMEAGSPAACPAEGNNSKSPEKDEL